jgi:GAF domain-containing protein/ribonuclease BN (tRNA processing enzyme)
MQEGRPSRGHMLISHTHWDHIQGIPFFTPFFVPGHEWDVYAPQGFGESLSDTLAGQMEYTYFPVTTDAFGATVRYNNLGEGVFTIDDVTIRTRYLNHPALTLAFRIECDGAAIVYACDHEPHSRLLALGEGEMEGEDMAHAGFMTGADLVIHDAQYLAEEYEAKRGWGHSTVEYAVAIGAAARAKQLALTHHDPNRTDAQIDVILDTLRRNAKPGWPIVFAAAEGMEIRISADAPAERGAPSRAEATVPSAIRGGPASETPLLLLVAGDDSLADKITRAVVDEPLVLMHHADVDAAVAALREQRPALVLAESGLASLDALSAALAGRGTDDSVPLVLLGGDGPADHGAADRLDEPWSVEYARSRIRTWLMRGECHWMRAPVPRDELVRLAALRALSILDTPREERFDRFTRLAAALFKVPIALVSLVDSDRQWFKSCHGTDLCESSRETSFCAHAVVAREMMIVPDALADPRFRDNPVVAEYPRVRFYAGAPIHSPDGHVLGTLCILDLRPRDLSSDERRLLADMAGMVETEVATPMRPVALVVGNRT